MVLRDFGLRCRNEGVNGRESCVWSVDIISAAVRLGDEIDM